MYMKVSYGQSHACEMCKQFNCNIEIEQLMLPNHYEYAFLN